MIINYTTESNQKLNFKIYMKPSEQELKEFFSSEIFNGVDVANAISAYQSKFKTEDKSVMIVYAGEEDKEQILGVFSKISAADAMLEKIPGSYLDVYEVDQFEQEAIKPGGMYWMRIDMEGNVEGVRESNIYEDPTHYFANEKGIGFAEGTFFGENEEDAIATAKKVMDEMMPSDEDGYIYNEVNETSRPK